MRTNDLKARLTWTRATSSPKQVKVLKLIAVLDLPMRSSNIETDQVHTYTRRTIKIVPKLVIQRLPQDQTETSQWTARLLTLLL